MENELQEQDPRTEQDFADVLAEAVREMGAGVTSYREAGLLTNNVGIVVQLANGCEFELTIVQSEGGEEEDEDY